MAGIIAGCPACGRQRMVNQGEVHTTWCQSCNGIRDWWNVTFPGDWVREAECNQTDPDIFFPHAYDHGLRKFAKSICGMCPVRLDCLSYAIENHIPHGIWGGLTPQERHRLRKDSA